jgi:hypothetical protein
MPFIKLKTLYKIIDSLHLGQDYLPIDMLHTILLQLYYIDAGDQAKLGRIEILDALIGSNSLTLQVIEFQIKIVLTFQ